ncbi:MAG: hypothetical protein NZ484_00685 [Patescibacteria group bacterium]|nr:hypothetical protein [Patescibacteria group bacterium]MDW8279895.1 hypothetical protein [bacterium]
MQVIPAINCHLGDDDCVTKKINKIKSVADWVHLDIADGIFTYNKSWNNPNEWFKFNLGLNLEVHLMVEYPFESVKDWLKAGAKRVIVHWEAIKRESESLNKDLNIVVDEYLNLCNQYNAELVLSICMETQVDEIKSVLNKFKIIHVLAVYPGLSGQKFLPEALCKIKYLKSLKSDLIIEVDGGINPEIALKIKQFGGDIAISGHYLFKNNNFEKAFNELVNI